MNRPIPSLIPIHNGELHDFEITCADLRVPFSASAVETHIVRACRTPGNAMARFERAVPGHGAIKRVRKMAK